MDMILVGNPGGLEIQKTSKLALPQFPRTVFAVKGFGDTILILLSVQVGPGGPNVGKIGYNVEHSLRVFSFVCLVRGCPFIFP